MFVFFNIKPDSYKYTWALLMSYNTSNPPKNINSQNGNKEIINIFHRMTQNLSPKHHAMLLKMYLLLVFTFTFENSDRKQDVFLIRIILGCAFYLCLPDYIILV